MTFEVGNGSHQTEIRKNLHVYIIWCFYIFPLVWFFILLFYFISSYFNLNKLNIVLNA